jgi:NAD(P)-dependent dehydrogenase (short-subunit alcohol dehydrogenase family)
MGKLKDKSVMVTGGAQGIGEGIARRLASEGASVAVADLNGEKAKALAEELRSEGANAIGVNVDVGERSQVQAAIKEVVARFGRLDVLFNNAGMGAPAVPFEDLGFAQWQAVVSTNLTAPFLCTQHAFRIMKDQTPRGGRIINNGSISAHAPRPFSVAYTSTKHAITGLTKSTSLDCRKYDIACGQIDVGNAATPMTERMTKGVLQPNGQTIAEPRMDVDAVANAIVYMDSLPLDANVQFMTVMATKMPFVGRG